MTGIPVKPGEGCWKCSLPLPWCDCDGEFESWDDRQRRIGLPTHDELMEELKQKRNEDERRRNDTISDEH